MNKKDDLPAMPFYVGDWLKAPDIQCLSYDMKGLWFEMLCYMWESSERGYLLYSREELSRLLRMNEDLLDQKLKQLLNKGIYSVRSHDGAIFSRRMVRDQEIRITRTKAGILGGRRSFALRFAQSKNQAECENENENENTIISNSFRKSETLFFKKPSLEEIKAYAQEKGFGLFDVERFFDFYESKGWLVGKAKMKDWKAAVRNWARTDTDRNDGLTKRQRANLKQIKELTNETTNNASRSSYPDGRIS